MNKHTICFFLCTFFTVPLVLSQKINTIINSLKEDKLSGFVDVVNDVVAKDSTLQFEIIFSNRFLKQYKAIVFHFNEARFANKRLIKPYYKYRINLVCDGDKIISSILTNISLAKEKNVYLFNDTFAIKAFDKVFKDAFGATSQFDMLFKKDVFFGHNCSFGGVSSPDVYFIWRQVVADKNIAELEKWLFSHLPSYRVWAVYGLYELKEKGYKITTRQRNRIMTLWKSNAIINTCSGCEYFDRTESELINQYAFE